MFISIVLRKVAREIAIISDALSIWIHFLVNIHLQNGRIGITVWKFHHNTLAYLIATKSEIYQFLAKSMNKFY